MMTISTVRRIKAASGDFSTLDVRENGSVYVGGIGLKDARELEAFGNALVRMLVRVADQHFGSGGVQGRGRELGYEHFGERRQKCYGCAEVCMLDKG